MPFWIRPFRRAFPCNVLSHTTLDIPRVRDRVEFFTASSVCSADAASLKEEEKL